MLHVIQKCQTTSQPLISENMYAYFQEKYFIAPIALSKEKDEIHEITNRMSQHMTHSLL